MSNSKWLVAQIQKLAQELPQEMPVPKPKGKPGGAKPAGAPPGDQQPGGPPKPGQVAPPSGSGGALRRSTPIANMQKAIQDFAEKAVAYQKGKPERDKSGKIVYKISDEDDKRRHFNDFLAEQFSASADIHGSEFSTDLGAISKSDKLPTDIIQLNNIINGLQRIGPGSREFSLDGNWDFRTNNAIRNVYAIATALVAANEALGGAAPNDPRVFRRADLAKLKSLIPTEPDPAKSKETPATLSAKAEQITPLIEKLTRFYSYYSKSIMDHPDYKRYINDDRPLLTVKPGQDPAQLDTNQAERMKNSAQITLPYLRVMDKDNRPINVDGQIALNYLQSRQGLQKMMVDLLGYQPNEVNNGAAMRRIVKTFIDRINSVIEKNKPEPQPVVKSVPNVVAPNTQNIA